MIANANLKRIILSPNLTLSANIFLTPGRDTKAGLLLAMMARPGTSAREPEQSHFVGSRQVA